MAFAVGPGIAKRLAQYGDEAVTDEVYLPAPKTWTHTQTYGKSGRLYTYLKATNQIHVFDPASSIDAGAGPDPVANVPIVQVPSPNFWEGREGHEPIALVIHSMAGTLAGTDAWFKQRASEVSAHYGVGLDGKLHQYVSLANGAWANGVLEPGNTWPGPAGVNPNLLTVSVETEDAGKADQVVTAAQYASTLAACRLALARFGSIRWLVGHNVISPQSRGQCPGPRWRTGGAFVSLGKESGLVTL